MAEDVVVQLDTETGTLNTGAASRERCSVDKGLPALRLGQQVLIRRDRERLALFTITEKNDAEARGVVRGGSTGVTRLGGGEKRGWLGIVVRSTVGDFTASLAPAFLSALIEGEARNQTVLIESVIGEGRDVAVLAPHGGDIEAGTDHQAARVVELLRTAGRSVRGWICQGWKADGGAHACWHITSTDIAPASFPKLNGMFSTKFKHAVAFHGWDSAYIGVGGGADEALRARFLAAIRDAVPSATVRSETTENAGSSPRNIVNRITERGNGIQIEQPLEFRRGEVAARIADAVAQVYNAIA